MRLSRQQIEAAYHQGLDAVIALVEGMQDQIGHLQFYVAALEKRLADMEARLGQNSGNSSRPPSSDVVRKKPPARPSTGNLNTYQFVPYERLSQMLSDMTGQAISTGTLAQIVRQGAEQLAASCEEIKQEVAQSAVVHADETGMYVDGTLYWMHVASTGQQTLYGMTRKRGKAGMDAVGVLPHVTGTRVARRALGLSAVRRLPSCPL